MFYNLDISNKKFTGYSFLLDIFTFDFQGTFYKTKWMKIKVKKCAFALFLITIEHFLYRKFKQSMTRPLSKYFMQLNV